MSNTINEMTNVIGGEWVVPHYDPAGNMIEMPEPNAPAVANSNTFDAWNRLVEVSHDSMTIQRNVYDGENRRVSKSAAGASRHCYFSDVWQTLEERVGSSLTAERQFIWGQRYIDDLVLRDRSTERLYALQDPNWNVTGICASAGAVSERYAYAAYGEPTFFNEWFTVIARSACDWETLFAGYLWSPESGLYIVRYRLLNWQLGCWLSRDQMTLQSYTVPRFLPSGATERLGVNGYQYVAGRPTMLHDATGLAPDEDPLVLGPQLRSIEPPGPPQLPDIKPFTGKIKFSPGCGSACLWVKTEYFGHEWVCGQSGEQAIDGVYGVCAGGGVHKVTDGCTLTINCVNVGPVLPPAMFLGGGLQVSCVNALARCIYAARGGCQADLWPLIGPIPPPPGTPLGLPKYRRRNKITLDLRLFI